MEWLDKGDGQYWAALGELLTTRLRPMTLSFFSHVPAVDAEAVIELVSDGKKLRGCLVLAVCEAFGGSPEDALPAAVAVECVQAASLIHDDLVDDDMIRRDRPATWIVQGGRRAVLLGDLIFATALYRSAEAGHEQVRVLAKAIALVAAGAYREPLDLGETRALLEQRSSGNAIYEHIIQAKTGALFAAAAELGADAAAAPPAWRAAAAAFGGRLGEAYQMADDLADLVSLPPSANRSPQQRAALAVLSDFFSDTAPGTATAADSTAAVEIPASAGRLAEALEGEIRQRVLRARQALACLPAGPRLEFLRALPAALVGPLAAERVSRSPPEASPHRRRPRS